MGKYYYYTRNKRKIQGFLPTPTIEGINKSQVVELFTKSEPALASPMGEVPKGRRGQ